MSEPHTTNLITNVDDKHQRTVAALQRWIDATKAADEHFDALVDIMGLEPDGPTLTAVYALQGALTAATADLVGDHTQWLEWFWTENGMGATGIAVPLGDGKGGTKPIRTAEDLAWLLSAA